LPQVPQVPLPGLGQIEVRVGCWRATIVRPWNVHSACESCWGHDEGSVFGYPLGHHTYVQQLPPSNMLAQVCEGFTVPGPKQLPASSGTPLK
jgi:hypothetical protein